MKPQISEDIDAITECLLHAPGFHACVLGPVPFGQPPDERVKLIINAIIMPSMEDALDAVWAHVHNVCQMYDHPFLEEEWDLVHLQPRNCN